MKRLRGLILFLIFAVPAFGQETAATFTGKLDRELVVETFHIYQRVWSAAADTSNLKFSPAPEKGALISVGELIDQRVASGKSQVLLVEPPIGNPYIWFDSDANGLYEAAEKFPMISAHDVPNDLAARLTLPIKNSYFSTFPI